ncbi:hypothetical protein ASPTUDRAFT_35448 [Aspergillus tubingensis CBS 134.48]|uniref:Uncharacterized protein n=1 Tax=Aspergillus tubingensis (strain CBS 134.48) TaxID=767770 RepID=A0A1L9NH59_ASPTC|nr:hypothetical protein ASPTUDRAFT_35448 [Aspergillus tubingensis CBS 134.48]
MNATTKVLHLPELLEEILLYQDCLFIFLAQRHGAWVNGVELPCFIREHPGDKCFLQVFQPFQDESYCWKIKNSSGQETSSSGNNNGVTMGQFIDYWMTFSRRFGWDTWLVENDLPNVHRNVNEEKCFFELTILGVAITYGQAQRLWRVKCGIPTLENLIDMEDLRLQIPTGNEEEWQDGLIREDKYCCLLGSRCF